MSRQTTPRRGRPPLAWLTSEQVTRLPLGTAVLVERRGRHGPRITGRITAVSEHTVALATPLGDLNLPTAQVRRARTVPSIYNPGDAVLKRHVPAATWRGGVVRTDGTDVLVEEVDGAFVWLSEDALEPAEARDPAGPPPVKRGPVSTRERVL